MVELSTSRSGSKPVAPQASQSGVSRPWSVLFACVGLLASTVVTAAPAAAVDMVDVTVTIIKFEVLDDPDPAPFQGDGDFFGRVRIGSNPFQDNESDQIESNGAFLPYWTFTNTVDRDAMPSTTVTIQILDDDTGLAAPDDLIDLDPIDNDLDLALSLDLDTGFWTGDVPQNTGFSEGDGDTEHAGVFEGGERGRIWFDISLSSTGDIDGDGIPDGVERFGIRDAGGNVTTDMAALGADPCRSTVAIEIDHLVAPDHDHRPDPAALQEAVDAFGDAPVAAVTDCPYAGFPAEPSGVNLVIDDDDAIDVTAAVDEADFGIAQLDAQRESDFDPDREPYFFYNVWAHTIDGSSSSGVCRSTKKGFMVTLGNWSGQNGTVRDQSGTLIHELGHTLGLGHGGGDGVNFKPNYLSVMNYRYQTIGIPEMPEPHPFPSLIAAASLPRARLSDLAPVSLSCQAPFVRMSASPGLAVRRRVAVAGLGVAMALVGACDDVGSDPPDPAPSDGASDGGRERPPSPLPEAIAPRVQLLHVECRAGDLDACRELAVIAPSGSVEQRFGATCGNREAADACGRL